MTGKRLVIVGATGMVGGYALRYAVDHPAIELVTAIGRRTVGISHPKLKEVTHPSFADCAALVEALKDQDVAVFCLGTYTGAVSDAELRAITVDYTIEFASVLCASSPGAAFSFLSGNGADPTGQSRFPFARYKGEAETALLAMGFPHVYIFPARVHLPGGAKEGTDVELPPAARDLPVFRIVFPNQVIPADDLGRVMVDAAVHGTPDHPGPSFENRDIRTMVGSLGRGSTTARAT